MDDLTLIIQKLCVSLAAKLPAKTENGHAAGRSVLVTSAHAGEGKTFIAGAMAVHLSKQGQGRVLLVDANFERPQIHRRFKVNNGSGFYAALSSDSLEESLLVRSDVSELDILTAGDRCQSSILFNQQRVSAFLERAKSMYSWIIFDGDRILGTGGNGLSRLVDGILVVVDSRRTRRQVVRSAISSTDIEPERLLGVVLNKRKYEIPSIFYRWV